MLHCERCGTSFNGAATGQALACPRCHLKDGVYSPLSYQLSGPVATKSIDRPTPGLARKDRFRADPSGTHARRATGAAASNGGGRRRKGPDESDRGQ